MGSECVLHLWTTDGAIAHAAEDEVLRIESRYSRYRPDSLLTRINQVAAAGGMIEVDEETGALLDYAFACHRLSDGLFDITTGILRRAWNFSAGRPPAAAEVSRWLPLVGMEKLCWERPRLSFPVPGVELDFGGLGKEYAADRAAAVCTALGAQYGLVDLGGDIRVIGPRIDGGSWEIAIRNPASPERPLATVRLAGGALATSGDYERYVMLDGRRLSHILHPATGWPVHGMSGISVVAGSCLLAGSLATIAMLKGDTGRAWLAAKAAPHVWVDSLGRFGTSATD